MSEIQSLQSARAGSRLPSLLDATHLFKMLFGAETLCEKRKSPLVIGECTTVACYADKTTSIKFVVACDLAFANGAGAALSAIPSGSTNTATKTGRVADNTHDNLIEVMNIAVNLFTNSFNGRLVLASVSRACEITPEIQSFLTSTRRLGIDVAISRYEPGRVDLIGV